jgi:hypothetical protein
MLKLSTHSGFHDLFLNSPKNNTIDDVEKYMYMCNSNIRSVRNKLHFLQNVSDEYDILCVTESHFEATIGKDDLEDLDCFFNAKGS